MQTAAGQAEFAGRKPAVGYDDLGARELSFIGQHATKHTEPHVTNGPCELPVLHHALHVEVLKDNLLIGLGQSRRELVQPISTNGGNPGMQPAELALRFVPVGRKLDAPGELPIASSELL